LLSSVAQAQPGSVVPDPSNDELLALGSSIIGDRFNGDSRLGIELSYLALRGDFTGGDRGGDLHAHYVDSGSGLGGYASIAYASAATHYDGDLGYFGSAGNLELGGLFATTVSRNAALIFRVGGVIPTAPDDNIDNEAANVAVASRRNTDLALALSRAKGARVSVSPILRSGDLFARFDLGVDTIWTNYGSYSINSAL
jgi:hypothetical protein